MQKSLIFIFMTVFCLAGYSAGPDQKVKNQTSQEVRGNLPEKFIKVKEPLGHRDYYVTNMCTITWQSRGITQPVNIYLINQRSIGDFRQTLAENIPITQEYFRWCIGKIYKTGDPIFLTPADGFRIEIRTVNGAVKTLSDRFGIFGSGLHLQGGRLDGEVHLKDTIPIRWGCGDKFRGRINLELWSGHGPRTWNTPPVGKKLFTIAENISAAIGIYNWVVGVPANLRLKLARSGKYKIRIYSLLCPEQSSDFGYMFVLAGEPTMKPAGR